MKGTEQFKKVIKSYLDSLALADELFRERYEKSERTIDDVVTYILNQVKASGCIGFDDEEIFSMAIHCIDEPDLEIGSPLECTIVSNHHIELTEEEKAEQKTIALKRFQDMELQKFQSRNKPKTTAKTNTIQPTLSLFD